MPFPLTREQEKALARAGTWQGPMAESLMRKQFQEEVGTGLGLDAIANIRRRESEEDEMIAPARSDLSMLGKKIGLAQETGDPEELARMKKSLSPRGSLTPHISQLQEKATPTPFSQLREEEITAKGLGELPEVQGFLKGRAETSKLEAAGADRQKTNVEMIKLADLLEQSPEYKTSASVLRTIANSGVDISKFEDILKNLGSSGEEDVKQSGRVGISGLEHRQDIGLEQEKQTGRETLQGMRGTLQRDLFGMKQEAAKEKEKKKKTSAKDSFGNVFAVYDQIGQFVPPVGGAKGMAKTGFSKLKSFVGVDDPIQALSDYNGILQNQAARVLGGEKGVMTDKDVKRFKSLTYKPSDTAGEREIKRKAYKLFMDPTQTPESISREMGVLVTRLFGKDVQGTDQPAYKHNPNIGASKAEALEDNSFTDEDEKRYQELLRKFGE